MALGAVSVNGATARASRLPVRGDLIAVVPTEREPLRPFVPHPITLDIVYEDDQLAVINKPAGLVVHPAPGHWDDTLVNALVARGTTLAGGAEGRPGIVHRLDRDTSGLMVVAKTEEAHRKLAAMIAARRVVRIYAALVWGHLDEPRVTIDAPIGRSLRDRKRMAILPVGRRARTDAWGVARLGPVELVRVELETGRTHQIRVHLESIGHPVVGDPVYGGGGWQRISGRDGCRARAGRAGTAPGAARRGSGVPPPHSRNAAPAGRPLAGRPLAAAADRRGRTGRSPRPAERPRGARLLGSQWVNRQNAVPADWWSGRPGRSWLLPVDAVVAVLRQAEVIRVPGAAAAVKGLVHHRGRIISGRRCRSGHSSSPGRAAAGTDLVVVDAPDGGAPVCGGGGRGDGIERRAAHGPCGTGPGPDRGGAVRVTQRRRSVWRNEF